MTDRSSRRARHVTLLLVAASSIAFGGARAAHAEEAAEGDEAPPVVISPSLADPPPSSSPPSPSPVAPLPARASEPDTYTLEMLAVDGASLAVAVAGVSLMGNADTVGGTVATVGFLGLAFGNSVEHLVHGHGRRALVSVGLHVGLPVLGLIVGVSSARCTSDELFCGLSEAGIGFLVGGAVALGLDAFVLARWSAISPDDPPPSAASHPRFAPTFIVTKDATAVGLGGTF